MKRSMFIAGVVICTLLLVTAIINLKIPINSRAISRQSPIVIENETTSMKIVSATIEGDNQDTIRVKVKNVGDKPVLGYVVRFGDGLAFGSESSSIDFTPKLQAGDTNEISLSAINARTEDGVYRLNLSLCMFEGLQTEGDWDLAQKVRERFEGKIIAFNAARAEMDALFDAPQLDLVAFNSTLKQVSKLSLPEGLTEMQKAGFQMGVENMQWLIKDVTSIAERGGDQLAVEQSWQKFRKQAFGVRSFSKRMNLREDKKQGGITQ